MVFSSVPAYLDPTNWHQQPNHHLGGGTIVNENPNLPPLPPPPPSVLGGGGGDTGSIRPGLMADRGRVAKLPQPEIALKCPRCESTNTKFCYFNNYSLTQPRHFCKMCRRYWTRGGALRNVPVGGGCRRNNNNKRSKGRSGGGSQSKSPVTGGSSSTTSATANNHNNTTTTNDMIMPHLPLHPPPQLPYLPPLHHLSNFNNAGEIGLNFGGLATGSVGGGSEMDFHSSANDQQWRMQQFVPFFAASGLGPPPPPPSHGLYHFEGDQSVEPQSGFFGGGVGQVRARAVAATAVDGSGVTTSAVKMEENHIHEMNLSRNFLSGVNLGGNDNHHYWGVGGSGGNGNAWTDFNSSSTSHIL